MLRALFDLFQITESQLSKGALLRLRFAAILGLLSLPLGVAKIKQHGLINFGQLETWVDYAFLLAVMGFFIVGITRSVNRLYIPDAYLDESEIMRKRQVNGMVFSILMHVGMTVFILLVLLGLIGINLSLNLNTEHYDFMFILIAFMSIFCLQGLLLSFIAKPLAEDDLPAKLSREDFIYLGMWIAVVVTCTGLAFFFGR